MKKLMLAAAGAAIATGAFAVDPLVYDYRASVTHMYVKLINVRQSVAYPYNGGIVRAGTVQVYQKYQKSASLNGYLVWDTEGVTSRNLNDLPQNAIFDQGRNRAFLVVQNSSAESNVRRPKILPAILDAKWFDTQFSHDSNGAFVRKAGTAEGTLYVGGEFVMGGVKAKLDNGVDVPFNNWAARAPYTKERTPVMFSDYLWTSMYLFGQYNGPQWSGSYANTETYINRALVNYFRLPATHTFGRQSSVYHDTWMNHAGIGRYTLTNPGVDEICCGLSIGGAAAEIRLDSLQGNMKGGLYICSDNGYIQATGIYEPFLGVLWEDQFFSVEAATAADRSMYDVTAVAWVDNADDHQSDVWTDGNIEQNTTDVLYGSWSIKRTTSYTKTALTWEERNLLKYYTYVGDAAAPEAEWATRIVDGTQAFPLTTTVASYNDLLETIKGAALRLNSATTFCNGREIYNYAATERFAIPFITPRFARAYGLDVYGR